jgi:hypothetical protein
LYEVFDDYVLPEDWYKGSDADRLRFNLSLARVVNDPDFQPDRMGVYLREKVSSDDEELSRVMADEIDARVADAWAVQDFLSSTMENPQAFRPRPAKRA